MRPCELLQYGAILRHVDKALLAEFGGVAVADEEGELVEGLAAGGEVVAGFGFQEPQARFDATEEAE